VLTSGDPSGHVPGEIEPPLQAEAPPLEPSPPLPLAPHDAPTAQQQAGGRRGRRSKRVSKRELFGVGIDEVHGLPPEERFKLVAGLNLKYHQSRISGNERCDRCVLKKVGPVFLVSATAQRKEFL
jgi:hypothetical protein